MAIKARIELKKCASHSGRGKKIKINEPFISTNSSDIAYYQSAGVFSVSIISDQPVKQYVQSTQVLNLQQNQFEDIPPKDDNSTSVLDGAYTKTNLSAIKKSELILIANDEFGLEIEEDKTKPQIVSLILKAQIDTFAIDDDDEEE